MVRPARAKGARRADKPAHILWLKAQRGERPTAGAIGASTSPVPCLVGRELVAGRGLRAAVAPAAGGAPFARLQHTPMLEGMLLLLLAIGGGTGSPAGALPSQTGPDPVVGIWRGTWTTHGVENQILVDAIVTAPSKDGQLHALVATGVGRLRRLTRIIGRLEADGARFTLPGGGSLRLAAGSASRLIGVVKGAAMGGPMPGDGTLELVRVRR